MATRKKAPAKPRTAAAPKARSPKTGSPKTGSPKTQRATPRAQATSPKPKTPSGALAYPIGAIEDGKIKAVKVYLASGGDINAMPRGAMRPFLGDAVARGDLKLVKELLAQGADPNGLSATATSPLQEAAELGIDEIVTLLLEHGAAATYRDTRGMTALHAAALCCRVAGRREWRRLPAPNKGQVIKRLLDVGVDPRIRDNAGRTAWFFARDGENTEGLDLLPADDAPAPGSAAVVAPVEPPEVEMREQAREERAIRRLLVGTVKALKAAKLAEDKMRAVITAYLEKGDALGCSPAELWDYFGTSTPSLPAQASFTKRQEEQALELFGRLTKARYQR